MNDTVSFIHTADLHLDSPLKSLAARNKELAGIISQASRTVLRRLVNCALERHVDALLIAGDLFDGDQRDVATAMVLQRELRRLQTANIPVFIIKGNHDAQAQLLDVLDLPENVYIFDGRGGRSGARYFADERAVIHGVSFAKRRAPQSLLPKYGKPEPNCFNIGMLHTSLSGADGHNDYAPCTVAELIGMGYDYWALGHIHKRTVHHENPAIVMPGNPLGRHINESGEKTVSLVTLQHGKAPKIDTIVLAPVQFERFFVDLSGLSDRQEAFEHIVSSVTQRRGDLEIEHLIVRIVLEGATALTYQYQRDQHSLLTQLRTEFELRDDIWVDDLDTSLLTQPQASISQQRGSSEEVVTQLQTLIDSELLSTVNLHDLAMDDLTKLTKVLPLELKDLFGNDVQSRQNIIQALLCDGGQWMLQQISSAPTHIYPIDDQVDSPQ